MENLEMINLNEATPNKFESDVCTVNNNISTDSNDAYVVIPPVGTALTSATDVEIILTNDGEQEKERLIKKHKRKYGDAPYKYAFYEQTTLFKSEEKPK